MERNDTLVVRALEKFAEPERRKLPPLLAQTEKFGKLLTTIKKCPRLFRDGIGLGAT